MTDNVALYANRMTAANENGVTLAATDDPMQWLEVYGNTDSNDWVYVTSEVPDEGVFLTNYAAGTAGTDGWRTSNGYLISRYATGAATSALGFFDTRVNEFYGTQYADRITLNAGSSLKVVDGMGGADIIDVNVTGIEVTGGGEGSVIVLGANATGATVHALAGLVEVNGASGVTVNADDSEFIGSTDIRLQNAANATVNAGMGNRVDVKQASGQTATVNVAWNAFNADLARELGLDASDKEVTTITSDAASDGTLVVRANEGAAQIQMGGSQGRITEVHVGTAMDNLWVIADQANALFLDLYFDNPEKADVITDLQFVAPAGGQPSGAMHSFVWQHGGTSTQVNLTFADPTKVNVHMGSSAPQTLASILGV